MPTEAVDPRQAMQADLAAAQEKPTIIAPTVGRVVWFYPADGRGAGQPLAAIVAHVWSDRCVNLAVFNENGSPFSETSVTLVQEGDAAPSPGSYCRWMPYQVGQAKRHGGAA